MSNLEETSDEDLLGAFVASGDVDALQVLLTRHESRVYGLAYRMLGDRHDALDATQEAFILTLRKGKSFRRESAFTTWLYRLTVNACRDLARKKARSPVPVEEVSLEAPQATDSAEVVEDRIVVQAALRKLPPDQREALVLREVGGLSYDEISAVLKVPVGTVKSRIARGRIALADEVGSEGPPEPPEPPEMEPDVERSRLRTDEP